MSPSPSYGDRLAGRVGRSPIGPDHGPEVPGGPDPRHFTMHHRLGAGTRHVATMVDAMSCAIALIVEAKCPCWGCPGVLEAGRCGECGCWWAVRTGNPLNAFEEGRDAS